MSSSAPPPNADLAAILATLASLNKTTVPQATTQPSEWAPPEQTQQSYPPQLHAQPYQQQHWPPAHSVPREEPRKTNVVDPSTITEWSAGLRCVMKIVATHDQMLKDIQKMMKTQHEHEAQWWKGREDLVKRQNARADGQKKLDDVLKGLGGATSEGKSNTSPEELASELKTFDMKVYRAQTQMVKEMSTRLKNMGVPFFGINPDLIIPVGKEEVVEGDGGKKLEKGMIQEAELVFLQKKMLSILEDMCTD